MDNRARVWVVILSTLLLICATLWLTLPGYIERRVHARAAPVDYTRLQLDRARDRLDRYEGDRRLLDEAKGILDKLERNDSRNPDVRVQMARYYIKGAQIDGGTYHGRMMFSAREELQAALASDPNHAEAHLLLGHLYTAAGQYKAAEAEFAVARRLGTRSPWLEVNVAEMEMHTGRARQAADRLQRFIDGQPEDRRALVGAYSVIEKAYVVLGDLDSADRAYRAEIELDPRSAWSRGNYAAFLLFRRGDADGAIRYAGEALELMHYGNGVFIQAAALYTKWATLRLTDGGREESEKYLDAARKIHPDMIDMARRLRRYPTMRTTLEAFRSMGVAEVDAGGERPDPVRRGHAAPPPIPAAPG